MKLMIQRINNFFISFSHLFLFALKTIWIIVTTDMKKESKEQNEEYARARKSADKERRADDIKSEIMTRATKTKSSTGNKGLTGTNNE